MIETIPSTTSSEERALIPLFDADELALAARHALDEARVGFAAIEAIPMASVTAESILSAWDCVVVKLEDSFGPISLLNNVHPDKDVRDAADVALIEESSFMTELFQNERLYERVLRAEGRTAAEKQLRKDLLEAFDDSGVSLPPDKRLRFKEISERLTELSQQFSRNIRENQTTLTFSPEECEGLPHSYLDRARRDERGNIIAGFDYPDYHPFMMNAASDSARRRYYIANTNRGTEQNLGILDEIVALRREIAGLYGVPSFAHYVTKRQMAGTPDVVLRFLGEVASVVAEAERRDLRELSEIKAERRAIPVEEARIERWDVAYWRERLREKRYAVDQEELRKYFPSIPTMYWVLGIAERLYGIRFHEAVVPRWHDDVIYLDVTDATTGAFIGGIYLDLFPREGKYRHAAAWPVRGGSRRAGRKPVSALVTNFDRQGLTHGEVETLLHELGHVLHGVLSDTEYNEHSGTSVERDFVEAPSQMFEEWAVRSESLALMREYCVSCPLIDAALVERLKAAKKFGSGIDYGRQHLYASYDMVLSGPESGSALETWTAMEATTPMGHVAETAFPGTFEHIASGYAAGYYGYMWAKAIALDLVSAFGANVMDPEAGRRFRDMILSRGSEEPARDLVERFLGRPVSSAAFFEEITGK